MAATFRVSAPRLASLDLGSEPIAGWWAGFWSRDAELSGELSLAQTWARDGVYVFADAEPADAAAFASRIASIVARIDPLGDLRMLWIRNAAAATRSIFGALRVAGVTLSEPCQLRFRGYAVLIGAGTRVELDQNGDGFVLTPASSDALALTTRAGLGRLPADAGAVATIAMTGPAAGTIAFPITLHPGADGRPSDLDRLDTGLRYFIGAAQDPAVELALANSLSTLEYPVFDPVGGPVGLRVQFDPVRPLDRDRSHLAFTLEQPILSHFVDRLGKQVKLRPIAAEDQPPPRLVFAESPTMGPGADGAIVAPGGAASAYLCPQGAFELSSSAGGAGPRRVLAGLSGSEYLGFEAESGNRLIFVPDQPAHAGAFRFATGQDDEPADSDDTGKLSAHATTSYVYFQGPASKRTVYYAQPDESLLWKTGRPDAFLEFMEVDAGRLPPPLDDQESQRVRRGIPLVPYRGVVASRAELARQLELRVIGMARRATLLQYTAEQYAEPSKVGAPLARPDPTSVTSLGLLANIDPQTNVWSRLYLAMPKDRVNPLMLAGPDQGSDPDGIKGPLRAALQTNQLFMVITARAAFERYGSLINAIVGIEGWSFNLEPSVWSQHGTILIFKFNLEPLVDLLADTGDWMQAEVFNEDPASTRARLLEIVAEARAARDGDDEQASDAFAEFNRLIDTPQWQGVLALQVDLPLSGLPDQIAALAVGIDDSKFKAHHVGVTLSPTQYDGSAELTMDPSAYFGLIYYQDPPEQPLLPDPDPDDDEEPELGPAPPPTYRFRVESLIVRFYNSLVVDFRSTVKLRVGALFEELAIPGPKDDPDQFDPTLALEGVLERHDGVPTYTFATTQPTSMTLASRVLRDVELRRTQMKTASAPGIGGGPLAAYFEFRGALRFYVQAGLDAFGFGTEPDDSKATGGLEYSRMLLHMTAVLPSPEQSVGRLEPSFRFDVTALIPDVPASVVRRRSLFSRFPLKLTAMVQSEPGSTPQKQGFLPVNSPMDQASVAEPWFALQFAVDLGTVGGLVGNKSFLADLLVAWSPSPRGTTTYLGLRLPPPFGGAKGFKIQGLFKVAMSDIDLFVSDPEDPAYTMVLRDIGFELLSLKFPPVGGVNFVLFGDPTSTAKPGSLGWYLAYAKAGGGA